MTIADVMLLLLLIGMFDSIAMRYLLARAYVRGKTIFDRMPHRTQLWFRFTVWTDILIAAGSSLYIVYRIICIF